MTNVKQKIRNTRKHRRRTRRPDVPQIWLTYDELAALMNCDPLHARGAAKALGLDRRRSRDGQTRAKLTPPLTEAFLESVLREHIERDVAACASALRATHEQMATQPAVLAPPASAAAG
jgi:hypothetical protein